METGTIISIVIIVVVVAAIVGLIALSYAVKKASGRRAEAKAQAAEEPAEEAEEAEEPAEAAPVAEPVAEETAEEEAEEAEEEGEEEEIAEEPEEEAVEETEEVAEAEPEEEETEEVAEEIEEEAAEEEAVEVVEEAAEEQPVAENEPEAEPETEPVYAEVAATEPEERESAPSVRPDVAGESLIVRQMSPALREALGVLGAEHDEEVYSVRYSYSFKARLVLAPEEIKSYYSELVTEIGSYKKMRRRDSRRQQNVSVSRTRIAAILFKGKKLCIALALDPKEFEGTKYRGKDVSGMKRFAATPMLFKVDSARRIKYAKVLIARLAEENGLEKGKTAPKDTEVPALTRDELIAAKEIKATGKKIEPEA